MNAAAITVIGAVIGAAGTAFFAMIFTQLQNLREDMKEGLRTVNGDIKALEHKVTGDIKAVSDDVKALELRVTGDIKAQGERIDRVFEVLNDHSARLARIESKLENDPPAQAA